MLPNISRSLDLYDDIIANSIGVQDLYYRHGEDGYIALAVNLGKLLSYHEEDKAEEAASLLYKRFAKVDLVSRTVFDALVFNSELSHRGGLMATNGSDLEKLDRDIFQQTIPLAGKEVTVGELLGIEQTGISYEFSTQAARYAWVAMQCASAEADANESKTSRDSVYAKVELHLREEMKLEKTTEAQIKALVLIDPEYLVSVTAENDRLYAYKLLRAITDAMRLRGDMLVSLGAQLRAEMDATGSNIQDTKEILKSMAGKKGK